MDYRGEYKLAVQIGQLGFYARVWLIVLPAPSSDSLKIEMSRDILGNETFQAAIQAGIDAAWRRFRRADSSIGGLFVRDVRLGYHPVDSTPKCIAYAAAAALLNALELGQLLPPFQPDKTLEEIIDTFDAE
jgi:hypothetical protein